MTEDSQSKIIHHSAAFKKKRGELTLYSDRLVFRSALDSSLNEEIPLSQIDHIVLNLMVAEHWVQVKKKHGAKDSKFALFTSRWQLFSPVDVHRFQARRRDWIKAFEQVGVTVKQSELPINNPKVIYIFYASLAVVAFAVVMWLTAW